MPGVLALPLALGACGDPARDLQVGSVGYVNGFAGGVVADEPRATMVGRDVLSAGGSAADAAVAMAFTLTVTLPSSAGIGGGGVCLVHDRKARKVETLDFLPPPPEAALAGATEAPRGQPLAVPALPRGLYALQSRYGRLRWEQLIAPAEVLARMGEPVSRALARQMAEAGDIALRDPVAAQVFTGRDGGLPREGELLTQLDLAAVLGRLRQRGPGDLYSGQLGQQLIEVARREGGVWTVEGLRAYAPRWLDAPGPSVGNETLHFPPAAVAGGEAQAAWFAGGYGGVGTDGAAGATGLVVADRDGNAVACALTMNGPFGTGRMLAGTGLFVARAAPALGQSLVPLAVGLEINANVHEFQAGYAAGGGGAVDSLVRAARAVSDQGGTPGAGAATAAGGATGGGQVNILACPRGIPPWPGSCGVAVDPRGAGYGLLVGAAD